MDGNNSKDGRERIIETGKKTRRGVTTAATERKDPRQQQQDRPLPPPPPPSTPPDLPSSMRALEYRRGTTAGLFLTDRPVPILDGSYDVLLRVRYAGVCGSDLRILAGTSSYQDRVVLGHEMVVTVVAAGPAVDGLQVGDAATMCPQFSCGECRQCKSGWSNFCEKGGYDSTVGYYTDGCFAEYVSIHSDQVYTVPSGLTMKEAVLSEPFNCLLNGMKKLGPALCDGDVQSSPVLIMGGGICGLLWSALLRARGVHRVTLTELKDGRRRIANKYLADTLDLPSARVIRPDELSQDQRFDIVIECCGQVEAVEVGYTHLDIGGTLLIFGGPPKGTHISIDPSDFLFREITIKGSVIGQATFIDGMKAIGDLSGRGYLDWDSMGVEVFEIEQHEDAIEQIEKGHICKAIFQMHH